MVSSKEEVVSRKAKVVSRKEKGISSKGSKGLSLMLCLESLGILE